VVRRQLSRGEISAQTLEFATALIEHATGRAVAQVDGLLDLARLEAGQSLDLLREPADLCALVRSVVDEYQLAEGVQLTVGERSKSLATGMSDG